MGIMVGAGKHRHGSHESVVAIVFLWTDSYAYACICACLWGVLYTNNANARTDIDGVFRVCRLLPQFTPGRALMWGSILALWGTGALVMSSSRALNIQRVSTLPCPVAIISMA